MLVAMIFKNNSEISLTECVKALGKALKVAIIPE